ncbi:MAG: glycosyl hydrolase family 28-related protein [FCB group bacterium]|jgi:hypothetical protein|nr:glycosyl hydrolase family 28-related protein [FCB group bacterium]
MSLSPIRRRTALVLVALLPLFAISCPGSGSPWRSALYPASWQPGYADAQGRFLHDFSYAGYRNGEAAIPDAPPLPSFDVSAYGADPTGQTDSTGALQASINAAVDAGGGVVKVPQGIFRCDGRLLVQGSNVILRGAGRDSTRLYFTQSTSMANRSHLTFQGNVTRGADIPLAQDGQNGSNQVIVNDATSLSPGDEVAVGWTISEAFVAEHGMTGTWQAFNGQWRPFFRRTVVAVDSNVITLDVPLRYPARLRDGASLRKETGYLRECGLERLSLSNAVDWDAAWSMYRVHLLKMIDTEDSWIRDVGSFASPLPDADGYHLQNCGFGLVDCKRITVADCRLEKAQNRGTGGCGYLFEISRSNEVLLRDCAGIDGRHNFIQNWDFGTTGCVFLRCRSAGGRNLLGKNDPIGVPAYSEYHHSLAMACLVDSCILDDGWYGGNRQDESSGAGHSVTQSVYWNTSGKGIVKSWQYGWGCVIGTRGVTVAAGLSDIHALLGSAQGTAPEDWTEGIGSGQTLEPSSLYEDQLARRRVDLQPTFYR